MRLVLLLLLGIVPFIAHGFDKSPQLRVRPDISSLAYMVVDPHTNSEILSGGVDTPLPPASLTKVMTAYIVATKLAEGTINLLDEAVVPPIVLETEGSKMFLEPTKLVTVDQLLFGLIVLSGNDAAYTLAVHISGSEEQFVNLMNYYVQLLNMRNCRFSNSSGLPAADMKCSLRSLMLLSTALMEEHPAFYQRYFATKIYSYNGIPQNNRNRLLFYFPEVDGIKTGSTQEAGFNVLVSAVRDGHRVIAGVMGAKTEDLRTYEVQKLLNYSFLYYKRYILYRKGEVIQQVRLWKSNKRRIDVGLETDLYLTLPYVAREGFKTVLDMPNTIRAPISKNEPIGEMILEYKGEEILRRPLVSLEEAKEASLLAGFWDELLIFLK